jgi:hypothetical protein
MNTRDLTHQLNRIENDETRKFMKEAVQCFYNGLYRSCIVMTYNATTEDLLQKLNNLRESGTKQSEFNEKVLELTKQKNSNSSGWEETAINLADGPILNADTLVSVKSVRQKRHLSAHPSAHEPSSEEARYCVTEMIDQVLSKPPVSGIAHADTILDALDSDYLFSESETLIETVQRRSG